ncbi:polysaccharide biosynthesis protein [Dyadobacter psychrotolerans]|uniref:Polysaccharide biosynthesis protein n=1 Tax=Dyadobacter psychrotolerans TaxID=2541721 RepID=A0A4R5DVY2_9BACT|nr:polysaccharide biosynthesis protein [Dyadobacter psychrotolerans]
MYISTEFLSVEQLALSRLLLENCLVFSAFAHLGTPFIADKFFGLFRDDENQHRGILPFLLFLPFVGGLLFTVIYLIFTPEIKSYFLGESPMIVKYHFLVIPWTLFWIYITVLESYCRNNARIAVPGFIREVYLKLANVLLILMFGLGWLSFDLMLYLIVASYGLAIVFLIIYIKKLGKLYWRFPDTSVLTTGLFKQMLGYGSFTLLGGIGVNLMMFIDRSMIAGEKGLISTGIFIIAANIANIIEIPKKAIAQISIPLLSTALLNNDHKQIRTMNQKSALNQMIAGGVVFLLIWASIDDIFYLIPKGDTYGEGKYVVLFLALVKVFDIATGLNSEIILYSRYFRWATLFIVATAVISFSLNLWLIPIYGFIGAAVATALTTLIYSVVRMTFVWVKFDVLPFTIQSLRVVLIIAVLYAGTFIIPEYTRTIFTAMGMMVLRSFLILVLFSTAIVGFNVSEEITGLFNGLRTRFLK